MASSDLPLVRLAQKEDEPGVLEMCRRLHTENGLFSLNEDKVKQCLQAHFHRKGAIVGVIGMPGQLEASTCLELTTFYYTDDWHLAELWNFVDEPYRHSPNAEALIQFGKDCAVQMKVPLFTGIITNRRMTGKVRLYRRLLGYPTGAFFVYNANWKSEPMEDHTDLRNRLRAMAQACASKQDVGPADLAKFASLFKEAAAAIDSADSLWGTKVKTNGK